MRTKYVENNKEGNRNHKRWANPIMPVLGHSHTGVYVSRKKIILSHFSKNIPSAHTDTYTSTRAAATSKASQQCALPFCGVNIIINICRANVSFSIVFPTYQVPACNFYSHRRMMQDSYIFLVMGEEKRGPVPIAKWSTALTGKRSMPLPT